MKSVRICFIGLVALVLLGGCAQAIGEPTSAPQDTSTAVFTIMAAGPVNTTTLTVTPIPPPTHRPTGMTSPTLTPATTIPPVASFTLAPTNTISKLTRTPSPTITGTNTSFVRPPFGGLTWTPDFNSYLSSYTCTFQSVYPAGGIITVKPRTDVIVQWKVFNSGPNLWHVDDIIYGYVSGEKMQNPDRGYTTLSFTVYVGDKINIQAHLKPPKEPGTYTMTWGMRKSNKKEFFCLFDVTVNVVK